MTPTMEPAISFVTPALTFTWIWIIIRVFVFDEETTEQQPPATSTSTFVAKCQIWSWIVIVENSMQGEKNWNKKQSNLKMSGEHFSSEGLMRPDGPLMARSVSRRMNCSHSFHINAGETKMKLSAASITLSHQQRRKLSTHLMPGKWHACLL